MEIYVWEDYRPGNTTSSKEAAILWNQAQASSSAQSQKLAQSIYQTGKASSYVKNIGIYSTRMLILEGASMPAALVELAYLSHSQEEKELWVEEHKSALVEILYQGILDYKRGVD